MLYLFISVSSYLPIVQNQFKHVVLIIIFYAFVPNIDRLAMQNNPTSLTYRYNFVDAHMYFLISISFAVAILRVWRSAIMMAGASYSAETAGSHTYTTHRGLYPNMPGPSVHECEGQGRGGSIPTLFPYPAPPGTSGRRICRTGDHYTSRSLVNSDKSLWIARLILDSHTGRPCLASSEKHLDRNKLLHG